MDSHAPTHAASDRVHFFEPAAAAEYVSILPVVLDHLDPARHPLQLSCQNLGSLDCVMRGAGSAPTAAYLDKAYDVAARDLRGDPAAADRFEARCWVPAAPSVVVGSGNASSNVLALVAAPPEVLHLRRLLSTAVAAPPEVLHPRRLLCCRLHRIHTGGFTAALRDIRAEMVWRRGRLAAYRVCAARPVLIMIDGDTVSLTADRIATVSTLWFEARVRLCWWLGRDHITYHHVAAAPTKAVSFHTLDVLVLHLATQPVQPVIIVLVDNKQQRRLAAALPPPLPP
ncbi:hypothetical protein H9P43_000279 [Blastocladiella emersonii ATCC 22665]|nr:hypothetical protein H9P43_000279 [Blastocladiella emersonii ATCC 22665]